MSASSKSKIDHVVDLMHAFDDASSVDKPAMQKQIATLTKDFSPADTWQMICTSFARLEETTPEIVDKRLSKRFGKTPEEKLANYKRSVSQIDRITDWAAEITSPPAKPEIKYLH